MIKQADTQDGETTKAAIGKLNFGNQNNIKEMIYRLSEFFIPISIGKPSATELNFIRFLVQTLANVVHATGGVDSTLCRTHIFLSEVGPGSVSHCTWHFPPAHVCACLKTCRERFVWTSAHFSQAIFSRHVSTSFDRCPWLFLILLYSTASTDNLTPADGSQANQKVLLRAEGCCLALWPNTTLSQVMSPTPGSKSAVSTLRSSTRLMSTASTPRVTIPPQSQLREPWRFSAASGSQQ